VALLDELAATIKRFVVMPPYAAEMLALWILHTYAFTYRDVSTYIGIESPEKRCGKTTLLNVLAELVHHPVTAANISSSAFFRVIHETQPTLIIDEADTFLNANTELGGILNAGYRSKTAYVMRFLAQPTFSQEKEPCALKKFPSPCPTAIEIRKFLNNKNVQCKYNCALE
jgi:putative DNA primase/helicase